MSYKTEFEDGRGYSAIDTNSNLNSYDGKQFLSHLQTEGVDTIIRYYASSRRSKTIDPDEAELIQKRGFNILPVYQDVGRSVTNFGSTNGYNNARFALMFANWIKQPKGTTILFAVDTNFNLNDYNNYIKPYFKQINDVVGPHFRIGCYGPGLILERLLNDDLIEVPWLSMSRSFVGTEDFFYSYKWAFRQIPPGEKYGKIHYDKNVLNWESADLGSFNKYQVVRPETSDVDDKELTRGQKVAISLLSKVKSYLERMLKTFS